MTAIWIAIAGAAGALSRYGIGRLIGERAQDGFPWATFIVNISGSFAAGLLFVLLPDRSVVRTAVLVGFLGAYTTFSALALETVRFSEVGVPLVAVANVAASVVAGIVAAFLGMAVARAL